MSIQTVDPILRNKDVFHHIDMGFLNRRLCISALPKEVRSIYFERSKSGSDHLTQLQNDHLLVTMLLDCCEALSVPTLLEALTRSEPSLLFKSTERLHACQKVYEPNIRVEHDISLPVDFGLPITVAYHTEHLVSSTGTMTLAEGLEGGYVQSIVGVLHKEGERFRVEPLVMGAPWFDHPRNGDDNLELMWLGQDFGEILPEDIDQFHKMTSVVADSAEEWLNAMKVVPEAKVKEAIAKLLSEPSKKDWGGEANDHFSANVYVKGVRKTAAFLLKGPSQFREMTLDMCGKRADQIFRLTRSECDICIVQHSHLIGEAVRCTLRALVVYPGRPRKYCFIDGQATYRLLKAYDLL